MIKIEGVRCKNCGNEISFSLNTDMDDVDVEVVGKCPHCGASIQVNVFSSKNKEVEPKENIDINEIDADVVGTALDNLLNQ